LLLDRVGRDRGCREEAEPALAEGLENSHVLGLGDDTWPDPVRRKPMIERPPKRSVLRRENERRAVERAREAAPVTRRDPFLLGFGIILPNAHGALGAWPGSLAGLSAGGATVLAAMAANASYIAAPRAVRVTLPEANPTLYLTSALAITFPSASKLEALWFAGGERGIFRCRLDDDRIDRVTLADLVSVQAS